MMSASAPAPKLTIVIPVYNRGDLVGRTLQCVVEQTLRPLNVILVDNNSTDHTVEVLRQWKDSHEAPDFNVSILHESTPGAPAARNRGLQEVTTPITMFFDSDDLMAPCHCQRIVDGFVKYPQADILGWDVIYTFPGRQLVRRFADRNCHWCNIQFGSMATQRYAARTELFRAAGGWKKTCRGWDDTELGERLLFLTDEIVKLTGPITVEVCHTEDSITGSSYTSGAAKWEEALEEIENDYRSEDLSPKELRHLLRQLNLRRAILAGDYQREGSAELGTTLLTSTLRREPSAIFRALYRFACRWRALGLPGAARLLRPFFS